LSFDKILEKKGIDVTLIRVTKTNNSGYLEESETTIATKAVVLPLTAEELRLWADAGITKASMKVYLADDIWTGDKIEINGKRFLIRAFENYQTYRKAIVEEYGS